MSLAFQRLLGEGTVAKMQLDKMQEIVNKLDDLSNKFITPDIKAVAKMLYPDKVLTPVYQSWSLGSVTAAGQIVDFNGRYFGHFYCSLVLESQPESDNETRRVRVDLNDGTDLVHTFGTRLHGDDVYTRPSVHSDFRGGATKFGAVCIQSDNCDITLAIVFHGFEITDPPVQETSLITLTDGNTSVLTYQQLLGIAAGKTVYYNSLSPAQQSTILVVAGQTIPGGIKYYDSVTGFLLYTLDFSIPNNNVVSIPQGTYTVAFFTDVIPGWQVVQVNPDGQETLIISGVNTNLYDDGEGAITVNHVHGCYYELRGTLNMKVQYNFSLDGPLELPGDSYEWKTRGQKMYTTGTGTSRLDVTVYENEPIAP